MDKSKRSQILKLTVIASLFLISPLIPTMFRSTYLYFIFNLLIVALGAEAGLFSFFSKPDEDKKHVNTTIVNPPVEIKEIVKPKVLVERCSSEKIPVGAVRVVSKVKKCPSTPSIFFIGNSENERNDLIKDYEDEEEEEEEEEVINEQELFTKAEMFIGNFYKQLKMQKENSWNSIHEFYQKAL